MKYFAPPILAVLLMGWPTLSSLSSLLKDNSGAAGAGGGAASLADAKKKAAEGLDKIQKTRADLDALATATAKPYGFGAAPKLSPDSDFAPGWDGYSKLKGEFSRVLSVIGDRPDPGPGSVEGRTREDLKRQIDKLKEQISNVTKISGSLQHEAAKQLTADTKQRLERRQKDLENDLHNLDVAEKIRGFFATGDYQGVIDTLKKDWQGDLTPEMESLLNRAEFLVKAKPLWEDCRKVAASCNPADWKPLIPRLNELLNAGDPASAEEVEKQLYDQLRRALASFKARDALALLETSPLATWAQRAKASLSSGGDNFAWACAKQRLRVVIDGKLPKTKRTADEGLQEAVWKTGDRVVATFQVQQGGTWYKFWLPNENPRADSPHIVMARDLTQLPDSPVTVRCLNEYKDARTKLLGLDPLNTLPPQCAERSSWEMFQAVCQRLAEQLKDLQKDVSFEEEVRFVQEVLSSWNQLSEFLES